MKWFYHYRENGGKEAVAGPFNTETECAALREDHRNSKPEDQCQKPVEKPDNYLSLFYSNQNP